MKHGTIQGYLYSTSTPVYECSRLKVSLSYASLSYLFSNNHMQKKALSIMSSQSRKLVEIKTTNERVAL